MRRRIAFVSAACANRLNCGGGDAAEIAQELGWSNYAGAEYGPEWRGARPGCCREEWRLQRGVRVRCGDDDGINRRDVDTRRLASSINLASFLDPDLDPRAILAK
jgi:hypothetical protein